MCLHSDQGILMSKKYHDWVYMADDSMNKVLKTVVVALHVYGLWVFLQALWEKYIIDLL